MKILLINLNGLGLLNEKFSPNLQSALILLEKGFKFDAILYNTNLVDCKCCCEITKSIREKFRGVLIAVIDSGAECCLKSKEAGANNYISLAKYNKKEVIKLLEFEEKRNSFRQLLSDYRDQACTMPALI